MSPFSKNEKKLILQIGKKFGISNIRIFGSRARGDFKANSDVDLLVNIQDDRSLIDLIAFSQELEENLGLPVDVVSERGISPYLKDFILAEAKPI